MVKIFTIQLNCFLLLKMQNFWDLYFQGYVEHRDNFLIQIFHFFSPINKLKNLLNQQQPNFDQKSKLNKIIYKTISINNIFLKETIILIQIHECV